jgi:hypothetical protein
MDTRKLTAQERAQNFNQLTRRNLQTLGTKVGAENGLVSFDLPKSRLLGGLKLMIEAVVNAKHAAETAYAAHEDAPFGFLKRVEVSLNNGFSPFSVSGKALLPYNMSIHGVPAYTAKTSGRGNVVQGLTASAAGTDNTVRFIVDLPITVNQRDPIGLILLQNEETLATVNISLADIASLAPAAAGFTFVLSDIKVTLLADTFTIPAVPEAFPDLSVLKLVQEKTEAVIAGENIIKLPVGMTYRKIGFIYYDATPSRQVDSDITSTIDILINQAQNPIRIKPAELAAMNSEEFKGDLPNGVYMLDFSDNGIPNMGGARDYVDTERMTEFWIKFTAGAAGTVKLFYETLSRLA